MSPADEWRSVLAGAVEATEHADAVRQRALAARSRAVQARIEGGELCAQRSHPGTSVASRLARRLAARVLSGDHARRPSESSVSAGATASADGRAATAAGR